MDCFGTTGGLRRSRLSFGTIRGRETLVEHARALELEVARFERDLNDPSLAEILARDRVQAQHLGVTGARVTGRIATHGGADGTRTRKGS